MSDQLTRFVLTPGEHFRRNAEVWGENDDIPIYGTWEGGHNCFVYLILSDARFTDCAHDRLFKVGISGNPWARLANIKTASPFKISLSRCWRLVDRESALWVERKFHTRNRRMRTAGEWFKSDIHEAICSIQWTIAELYIEEKGGAISNALKFLQFSGLSAGDSFNVVRTAYGIPGYLLEEGA